MENVVWDSSLEAHHDAFFDNTNVYRAIKFESGLRKIYDGDKQIMIIPRSIPDEAIGDLFKKCVMFYERGIEQGKMVCSRQIKDD